MAVSLEIVSRIALLIVAGGLIAALAYLYYSFHDRRRQHLTPHVYVEGGRVYMQTAPDKTEEFDASNLASVETLSKMLEHDVDRRLQRIPARANGRFSLPGEEKRPQQISDSSTEE